MYLHKFVALIFGVLVAFASNAQDLIRKVPHDATVVVSFNNKAVFDHLNIADLNLTLTRLGLFQKINGDNGLQTSKIEELGIDLKAKAYAYVRGTDSVQYIGALIPLSNRSQFESIIPKHKKVELVNSLPTIYSADRTMRLSWDDHTVYVLGGLAMDYYFRKEEVINRYGLIANAYDAYEAEYAEEALVDSAATEWEAYDFDSVADAAAAAAAASAEEEELDYHIVGPPTLAGVDTVGYDEYGVVDSILNQDEYADDYYTRYDSITRHNDSIKNELVKQWVNAEMALMLTDSYKSFDPKRLPKLDANTIAHIHAKDVFSYYKYLYPEEIMTDLFGVKPKFNYGIDGIDASVVVQGNKLKLVGSATLDKTMASYYKEIYNKKLNPKFYPFLDKDILGFFSFNVNTEAYLKNLPKIMESYYGSFMPRYSNFVSLGALLFDVALDQKAIAKVIKGDNLFVLNGVTKVDVTYTDYEYDDNYDYKEVEKTKTETIPQFLWMFSSDDTRIFEKIIQIGVQENELIDHDGIYQVKENGNSGITVYLLIKQGMVFIGNDFEKMESIQSNQYSGKGHAPYVALAKKNNLSLLFNTKRIPVLLDELDIPVERSIEETVADLQQYGDFSMTSTGVKGNRVTGEIAVEFPNKKGNALAFLFDVIDRWSLKIKE
ncbi:hypothetical protein [Sphingobacterium paucimobilis]|uniref:DUF4836 domain-containing protein n=1 Tax=Sphingobacterium paucimobilis HER1398 TaxID=1346330 RepID=U2HQ43_9SPHI|nr:hypothetical protein [Sphingobacterium paucimobilis]ERJ57572.1 hypothetical protein M472_02210 [Sphingobacterium paucimobilis HER1398]